MTQLGHYFWYSLPNRPLSLERVRRAWRTNGLDLRHLPEQRKPADVAAEAITITAGTMLTSIFTQLENSNAYLRYQVEVRNSPAADLLFDKATAAFSCENEDVLGRVRRVYEQNSTKLPAHKQRQALRGLLLASGAENVHGSIYFMPNALIGGMALASVAAMIETLYGDAVFHCVPVENSPDQVDYLKAAIDRLLTHEILELTNEVRGMLEDDCPRKWRSDRIQGIVQSKRALEDRGDRFANLLGEPGIKTFGAATIMDETVQELLALTEGPVVA